MALMLQVYNKASLSPSTKNKKKRTATTACSCPPSKTEWLPTLITKTSVLGNWWVLEMLSCLCSALDRHKTLTLFYDQQDKTKKTFGINGAGEAAGDKRPSMTLASSFSSASAELYIGPTNCGAKESRSNSSYAPKNHAEVVKSIEMVQQKRNNERTFNLFFFVSLKWQHRHNTARILEGASVVYLYFQGRNPLGWDYCQDLKNRCTFRPQLSTRSSLSCFQTSRCLPVSCILPASTRETCTAPSVSLGLLTFSASEDAYTQLAQIRVAVKT